MDETTQIDILIGRTHLGGKRKLAYKISMRQGPSGTLFALFLSTAHVMISALVFGTSRLDHFFSHGHKKHHSLSFFGMYSVPSTESIMLGTC